MAADIKYHVTFGELKRIIDFKGDQVEALRYQFLQVFSDVLSDQVAPAHVTFQRYDSDFQDFVDIPDGGKLEKGGKLKAIVSKSDKKQVSATLVLRNLSVVRHKC